MREEKVAEHGYYGSLEQRSPGSPCGKRLMRVLGRERGGSWEAEDKEAETQGFKTFN